MKRFCFAAFLAAILAIMPPPVAMAKDQVTSDGVKVDAPSPLRKLVPEQQLEAAALQQYTRLERAVSWKCASTCPR